MSAAFVWGRVVDRHEIKCCGKAWEITEFHPRKREGCNITRQIDESKIEFHIEELREGFDTIEAAIAAILMTGKAGRYGIRMRLGLHEVEE